MDTSGSQILRDVVETSLEGVVYCEENQIRIRQNHKKATTMVKLSNDFSAQFKLKVEEAFAAIDKETSAKLELLAKRRRRLEEESADVHSKLHGNAFVNLPAIQPILLEHFPLERLGRPNLEASDVHVDLTAEHEPSQASVDLGNEPVIPTTNTTAGTKRKASESPCNLEIQNMSLDSDGWDVTTSRKSPARKSTPVLEKSMFGPDFITYKVDLASSGSNGHSSEFLRTPRQDPSETAAPPASPRRTRKPSQHTSDKNVKKYHQSVGVSRTSKKQS